MGKKIACALASAVVATTALTTAHAGLPLLDTEAMRPAESIDTIDVRYYRGADFVAGAALGFVGAFVLTNPYYPAGCGCYRTYPRYYYHRYHYPDRFYHFGDYPSE